MIPKNIIYKISTLKMVRDMIEILSSSRVYGCTGAGPAEQQEEEPPLRREEDNNNDPPRLLEALSLMT
jgi:hypothetical protein